MQREWTQRKVLFSFVAATLLVLAPSVMAGDFPGAISLEMEAPEAEAKLFRGYLDALVQSSDSALASVGESGYRVLEAVETGDIEAYIAAKAIYGYRLETLADGALADLRSLQREHLAAQEVLDRPVFGVPAKITVTYGCGAELSCDNGSKISCRCANGQSFLDPPSTCTYKPNYNSYGGRVICDCSGTSFDSTRTCPYVPPTSCSPGCTVECGSTGGQCSNGQCFCY